MGINNVIGMPIVACHNTLAGQIVCVNNTLVGQFVAFHNPIGRPGASFKCFYYQRCFCFFGLSLYEIHVVGLHLGTMPNNKKIMYEF